MSRSTRQFQTFTRETGPTNFRDALAAMNLNWQVGLRPVYTVLGEGQAPVIVKDSRAVVRTDIGLPLSVVGNRYEAIQNDSFADIFDRVTGELGAHYVNGGMFDNGRRVFVQAELPDSIRITSDEEVKKLLTFITSHDATTLSTAGGSNIRVVCENTFAMALRDTKAQVAVRHTSNAVGRIEQSEEILLAATEYHNAVALKISALVATPFTDLQMTQVVKSVLGVKSDLPDTEIPTRTRNNIDAIMGHWVSGLGINAGNRGTAWAAYNALTQYSDHDRVVRGEEGDSMRRFESNLLGTSAAFKAKALTALDSALA